MRVAAATNPLSYPFRQFYHDLEIVNDNLNMVKHLDLVIFTGGSDISPYLYKDNPQTCYSVDQVRDRKEVNVYMEAKLQGVKMLGVCRGHQLINAMEGGTLIQDINPPHCQTHELIWLKDHPIANFYPDAVNSLHHQGYTVNEIAETLGILAIEPETGIVEVAKSFDDQILTVQFHPEYLLGKETTEFFAYINRWAKEEK